ncbi:MAG: serine/threonine protein kinase, partial [Planctomycetota bacterium]|nr:serine/threonine protein kinase [Planctomycetota bacterium]
AHQRQIIHQDIKPDNILLATDGRVKLADLGLAKIMRFGEEEAEKPALGTPQYVAPEVARRLPADARSDIYSLGAAMFHLVTGHPPYRGERATAILEQHLSAPVPDPRERNPSVPDALAAIIMRCMAKDPARRYATAQEVAAALSAFLAAHKEEAARERRPAVPLLPESPPAVGQATDHLPVALPARKFVIAAIALVAFAAVAVLAWGLTILLRPAPPTPQALLLSQAQQALAAGRTDDGLLALRNLRDQYAGTPEAAEAARLLAPYEEKAAAPAPATKSPLPSKSEESSVKPAAVEKVAPLPEKAEDSVDQEAENKAKREWEEAEPIIDERTKKGQYAEALALLQGFLRQHEGTDAAVKAKRR